DAGEHDFAIIVFDQAAHLRHDIAHRHRTRRPAAVGDNAKRAAVIAAILHLHESSGSSLETFGKMQRGFAHGFEVADAHFFFGAHAEIESPLHFDPAFRRSLEGIAEDAVDFRHLRECRGFGLRRATGYDNLRTGPLALHAADGLPRLRYGFRGHRTGIEDDGIRKTGGFRLVPQRFGFGGVQAAAESDNFNAHRAHRSISIEGSSLPSNSISTGPVIRIWSSPSRQSIMRSPPGSVTRSLRPVRLVRAAATAAAQAAEPQARVSPAPRSHVFTIRWSGVATRAS